MIHAKASTEGPRSFDLKDGDASDSLREFARQALVDIVYDSRSIDGVTTPEVVGVLLPKEALKLLLEGTGLEFKEDLDTGAFAVVEKAPSVGDVDNPNSTIKTMKNNTELLKSDTHKPKSLFNKILTGVISTVVIYTAPAVGQENQQEDQVFELNPFTVEAEETVGYLANTTLAGTRLKTQLRDIAASISVLTPEFIEDTASTDLTDLLVYATGVEVDGVNGNYTSGTGGRVVNFANIGLNANTATRVRGLADADRTRNYFGSIIPVDTYNVSRIVINRGANNILFGLGSPAGIINQSLVEPIAKNKNKLTIRTDDRGSLRGILDINRVLNDRVRLRIIPMHSDQRYVQDAPYSKEQRVYAAANIQLAKTTVLKVNGETGDLIGAPPLNAPPRDQFTNWWKEEVGQPTIPLGLDFRDRDTLTFDGTSLQGGRYNQLFVYGSNAPFGVRPIRHGGMPEANLNLASYDALKSSRQTKFRPLFTTINSEARRITQRPVLAGRPGYEDIVATIEDMFVVAEQIHDTSVVDYRNHSLMGRNNLKWHDIGTYNVSLQQTFFKGKAGIELSYDHQSFDSGHFNFHAGGIRTAVAIDVNEALPDGTPNPNLGKAFLPSLPNWRQNNVERNAQRAVFYVNIDTKDHWEKIGKWLGEHTFTALYETNKKRQLNYGGVGFAVEERFGTVSGMNSSQKRYSDNLPLGMGQYLDASVDSFIGTSSPAGANLRLPSDTFIYPTSVNMIYIDGTDRSIKSDEFKVLNWRDDQEALTTQSSLDELQIDSVALALQSRLLADHLVTTMGWRSDKDYRSIARDLNNTEFENDLGTHDLSGLSLSDGELFIGDREETFSWGTVFHVPEFRFMKDLGLGVSLFYNESENYNPSNRLRKPLVERFGEEFDITNGETTDYGATISLMDGKLVFKGTWYETKQNSAPDTRLGTPYTWFFDWIPSSVYFANTLEEIQAAGFDKALPSEAVQLAYGYDLHPDPDRPEYMQLETVNFTPGDVSYLVSRGFEFELNYNPTSQLRLFMNASKQKAVRDGIGETGGPEMERLFSLWNTPEIMDLWLQDRDSVNDISTSKLSYRALQQISTLRSLQTQNGQKSDSLRDWRFNVGGMYQFSNDSPFKGWSIGGALRWQDKPTIGYPIIDHPELGAIRDTANPVYGEADTKVDFWLRNTRFILDGKVKMTTSLTIRNLLDDDDLTDVMLNYAGLANIVRFDEGRKIILSGSFEF